MSDSPTPPIEPIPHAFTVDTEDWAALMCMYSGHDVPVSSQFAATVHEVLDLLARHETRATFFVVAKHAVEDPSLVREIAARGHEIGSHAWTHRPVGHSNPADFAEDIRRCVGTLEDMTGQPVRGHRSPLFSLLPSHVWALEAMAEAGLDYDSSITTMAWTRTGNAIPERPFRFQLPSGATLDEFPAPARRVGPVTLRFIGGRGARLGPASMSTGHVEERERDGLPAMVYVHNYEIVPDGLGKYIPRSVGARRWMLAASGAAFQLGVGRFRRLIERLLADYSWGPAGEALDALRARDALPSAEAPTSSQLGR